MSKKNPYDINRIFEAMTLDLISSLKRNLSRHAEYEKKEGFKWEPWQSAKLRSMGEYRKRNLKVIADSMQDATELVDTVLDDSFEAGKNKRPGFWKRIASLFKNPFSRKTKVEGEIGLPGSTQSATRIKEVAFFGMNEKKLDALKKSVKDDLQEAQHSVFRKTNDVYRQTIFKAEVNMSAGAKTIDQAIDMATKDFLEKGINSIVYKDGRRVSIPAYAEMALRTASQRATFLGEGQKRDEWGIYTVLMSSHDNCSPMCLPYQGTVLIDDVYTSISNEDATKLSKETGYTLLSEAMKHHAFHPNCRHTLVTFYPGISSTPPKADGEKAVERYQAEQHQRYIERNIRKYKRLQAGSIDEQNQLKYKQKVEQWSNRLKGHLKEHDYLRRDPVRERVDR